MNNSYSSPEKYLERWITPSLQQASRDHAVVVLTAGRARSEKVHCCSTLNHSGIGAITAWMNSMSWTRLAGTQRHYGLAQTGSSWMKCEKAPDLLVAVKRAVDRNPGKYRFVLSGSTNLLLMKQVSESLAGRAVYFILDPMALGEIHQTKPPDILTRLLAGEFPAEKSLDQPLSDPDGIYDARLDASSACLDSPQSWTRWWDGYVSTYLERDLRQVAQIDALLDFRENDGVGRLAIRPTAEPIRSGT